MKRRREEEETEEQEDECHSVTVRTACLGHSVTASSHHGLTK